MVGTCPRLGPESRSPCCLVGGFAYQKNALVASTPLAVYPSSTVPFSGQPPASATARPRSSPEMASIRRISDNGPNRKPVTFSTRPAHTLSGLVTAESKTTLLA
jgi:hypothetical protein